MKLALRFLMVLTIFSAVVMTGCEQQQATTTQEPAAQQTSPLDRDMQDIQRSVDRLMTENSNLQQALARQEAAIADLRLAMRSIQNQSTPAATPVETEVEVDRPGFAAWQWIIVIIVVLIVILIIYRLLRPKPFEDDEDEDFSSFDDDFGFDDDEEFGEEPATGADDEERK